jgi:hypothetical protein
MSFLPNSPEGTKKRISEKEKEEAKDSKGRTVKPFVPPRVDRKDMIKPESSPSYYEEDNEEEEAPVVPVRERVSSRVIRGVNPETFSAGVVIPYGDAGQPPTPLYAEPILNNAPNSAPREERIKIYNVKTKEKEKPAEYVKVFKPKKQPIISTPHSDKPVVPKSAETEQYAPAHPPVSVPKREAIPEKPRIPAFSLPSAAAPAREMNTAPALSIPKLQDREQPVRAEPPPVRERAQRDFYASQKTEYTQELGFTDILKGLERKDGFADENIPTDSEGVPVSHKTKRVMDAIFKQSKPSLFINMGKDDE